jgi:predicted tellurium resistance membrane protein TerC
VSELLAVDNVVAFLSVAALEIVLGIDNVVFIAILAAKLPKDQQPLARRVGLGLAMVMRILLLLAISWVVGLTADLFSIPAFWTAAPGDAHGVSGRDLIMLAGGLFLIGKATYEIHDKLEGDEEADGPRPPASFAGVIAQVVVIDAVFSLDSVITAVGMVPVDPEVPWVGLTTMVAAVVVAVAVMLSFAGAIAGFVDRHPTMKMLALAFLILIGTVLVAEGLHVHVPKGFVYFALAFSLGVEFLNIRLRRKSAPVKLHQTYVTTGPTTGGQSNAA